MQLGSGSGVRGCEAFRVEWQKLVRTERFELWMGRRSGLNGDDELGQVKSSARGTAGLAAVRC